MKGTDSVSQHWAAVDVPDGSGEVLTNATSIHVNDGFVRVGIDSSGCKHLLVPCGTGEFRQDRRSRGVALVRQTLVVEGVETQFADLVCIEVQLEAAFVELVDDIGRRIGERPEDAVSVMSETLREWRELLRYSGSKVDRSAVIGLRGELEVLRSIASRGSANDVSIWRGPLGEPFDFMRGSTILEVKTTVAQDGHNVQIHGLQQLDPPDESELALAFVRLRPDDLGESVPAVVDDLYALGVDREQLDRCLDAVGYRFELRDTWSEAFKVVEMQIWIVGDEFPGIRSSRISSSALSGVSDIQYAINLDAGGPPLGVQAQTAFLDRFAESA